MGNKNSGKAAKARQVARAPYSKTKYKGVYTRINESGRIFYQAQITVNRKRIHLGYFDNADEAAIAYNKAAKQHHGQDAYQNVITKDQP